jgi:Uncharacterized protein conserved in bacteria
MEETQSFWQSLGEISAYAGGVTLAALFFLLLLFMLLVAVAGSVIPVLPGPVFAFFAALILKFSTDKISWISVLLCLAITIASAVLDYVLPMKFTPTRAGAWGAFLGVFAGLIAGALFPPIAIFAVFLGPLLCAFAFEYNSNLSFKSAWKSGMGAFVGTMAGVFARLFAIFLMILICALDFVF